MVIADSNVITTMALVAYLYSPSNSCDSILTAVAAGVTAQINPVSFISFERGKNLNIGNIINGNTINFTNDSL